MSKFSSSANKSSTLSKLMPSISFGEVMNLYTAYSYGGFDASKVLAATQYADQLAARQFGVTKHYISLGAFWGHIAYKAINQVIASDKIPAHYKIALSVTFAGSAAGMAYWGKDIFGKQYNIEKTLKSAAFTASFFDRHNTVEKIENAFAESHTRGFLALAKNLHQLLSNKFIQFALAKQGADMACFVLTEKFFSSMFEPRTAMLFSLKDGGAVSSIVKLTCLNFLRDLMSNLQQELNSKLKESIKKRIEKKVAEIVLKDDNTQVVMKLGDEISQLPYNLSKAHSEASIGVNKILQDTCMPFIVPKNPTGQISISHVIENNAFMVLINSLIKMLMDPSIAKLTSDFLNKKIYGEGVKTEESEDVETSSQRLGPVTFNVLMNPKMYTYGNIQDIAKMGGNSFMLPRLLGYIEHEKPQAPTPRSLAEIAIEALKALINNCLYYTQFKMIDCPTQEKMTTLDQEVSRFSNAIGLKDVAPSDQGLDLQKLKLILDTLNRNESYGATRSSSEGMELSVRNYKLGKADGSKDMLHIPNLTFYPGKSYAVTGPIGTGKTTLLSDIAKCLLPVFKSEGEILHPTQDQCAVKEIFCGTTSFSPPGTTLLDRVIYRLPEEYRNSNRETLLQEAMKLFRSFNQPEFTAERLGAKLRESPNLSTGQTKMIILTGAILYKQFLQKPVVLVLDETLANLDRHTEALVWQEIKRVFDDSIIISVDHNAVTRDGKFSAEFYNEHVDLAHYVPGVAAAAITVPSYTGQCEMKINGQGGLFDTQVE